MFSGPFKAFFIFLTDLFELFSACDFLDLQLLVQPNLGLCKEQVLVLFRGEAASKDCLSKLETCCQHAAAATCKFRLNLMFEPELK
jgi:hypothetical protein